MAAAFHKCPPHYHSMFGDITNSYITPTVVVLGVICNGFFMNASYQNFVRRINNRLTIMTILMGTFDSALLLTAFFYYAVKDIFPNHRSYFNLLTPYLHGIGQVANTGSIWCVVVIVTLKHMAVGDPFRGSMGTRIVNSFRSQRKPSGPHSRFASLSKTDLSVPVVLLLLAVLVNIPAFFEIGVMACLTTNGTVENTLYLKPLRKNDFYRQYYKTYFRAFFVSCLPNVYVLGVTAYTCYRLRMANRSRQNLFLGNQDCDVQADNVKEKYQNLSSLILGIKFLLLRSPAFILDVLEIMEYHKSSKKSVLFIGLLNLSNIFILINSATNCLLFVKMTSWIKRRIKRINTIKKKKKNLLLCLHQTERFYRLRNSWPEILEKINKIISDRLLYIERCEPELANGNLSTALISNTRKYGTTDPCLLKTKRNSIAVCQHPMFLEVSGKIIQYIEELLIAIEKGENLEVNVIGRLHLFGDEHTKKNIRFTNQMWSEFKSCLMCAVADCECETQQDRDELRNAWNSFISMIIKEIKHGAYVGPKTGIVTQI
ncbi:hypothetical protein L596_013038 [Steinernema carpocapsae]|uniref:G-protein coupled receptors family 1 profile domain-containing protein n=1 Tax=Steinernema carpocapsae TaxID=34508 RepID=A0A4U5NZ70_STECR|nr:hypothetical protein L596_013038 [Steinernema carpocapsae]